MYKITLEKKRTKNEKKAVKEKRENHQSVCFIPLNSLIVGLRLIDAMELLQRAKIDVWSWSFGSLRKDRSRIDKLVWTSLVSRTSQSSRRFLSCLAPLPPYNSTFQCSMPQRIPEQKDFLWKSPASSKMCYWRTKPRKSNIPRHQIFFGFPGQKRAEWLQL